MRDVIEVVGDDECREGVLVDEVALGSVPDKAGLQVGDELIGWRREPSPPANPQAAFGVFDTPFDWMWLEVEQAHRGTVVLEVERRGLPLEIQLKTGEWNVHFNAERRS
ncbi:MAG: hypothetical protein HC942_20515, partial [Microcoleus sp. SU_5_6]|nr:hypothetical protein [Microcoleus sp. SU_5_6]